MTETCPACQAPVVWAISITTAAWTALDAEPSPDGTLMVEPGWDGHPRVRPVTAKLRFGRRELRRPHLASCARKDRLKLYHYAPPPAA